MEWVPSTLHTTSERGVPSITTPDAHTSAASSRLNWHPHPFKWTRPFRLKTKSGFCACAITFQNALYYRELQLVPLSVSGPLGISIKHEAYICQEFMRVCFFPAVQLPLFHRPYTWTYVSTCDETLVLKYQNFFLEISLQSFYRGADKSLAWPGMKQATATEDFRFHITYLYS